MVPVFFKKLTDTELIEKFIETNDQHYLGELYLRYHHLVYLLCQKYLKNQEDSKDATLEIFGKVLQTIGSQNIKNFKNWLFIVAKNHCLTQVRSNNMQFVYGELTHFENMLIVEEHTEEIITDTKDTYLAEALTCLKDEQKVCLEKFYFINKTYKEISDDTGFTIKSVKSHIQNGKRNLRNILSRKDGTYD